MRSPFYVHFLCLATEYAFVIRQMEASAAELLDDELRYAIGHEHEEQHEQDDLQHEEDVHDGLRSADGSARIHVEDARDEARIVLFRSGVVMAALQGCRVFCGRLRFLDAVFSVGEQIDRLVLDELFVAVEVTVMFAVVSDAAHLAVAVPLHAAVVMIGDGDVALEMRGFERELRVDEICANARALRDGDGDVRVGAIGYVAPVLVPVVVPVPVLVPVPGLAGVLLLGADAVATLDVVTSAGMVMFSSDACKAAEKKQKNMRLIEHAMTPEMPFDAK